MVKQPQWKKLLETGKKKKSEGGTWCAIEILNIYLGRQRFTSVDRAVCYRVGFGV